MSRTTLVRIATFLATVFAAWGVLSFGAGDDGPPQEPGEAAQRDYVAPRMQEVIDQDETDRLRAEAAATVPPKLEIRTDVQQSVDSKINATFDAVRDSVVAPPPEMSPPVTIPGTTDTASTATTLPDEEPPVDAALITGVVYLDIDGNQGFDPDGSPADRGLARIGVTVSSGGKQVDVVTDSLGAWVAAVSPGEVVVTVDFEDADIPAGFVVDQTSVQQTIECQSGAECEVDPVGFSVNLRPLEEVAAEITAEHFISIEAAEVLVATAQEDVTRTAIGGSARLPEIRRAALERLYNEFGRGIESGELVQVRSLQAQSPPIVLYQGEGQPDLAAGAAAGDVVATHIEPNHLENTEATEEARALAAAAVPDATVTYNEGDLIVAEGESLTRLHVDAINETSGPLGEFQQQGGLLAVLAVLVGSLGFYLARFRPEFWGRPRMVALIGILIVLAAIAVRATTVIQPNASWYVLPAVAFGFITAVLFDSRIAVLMALAVGVVAALGTSDAGVAVYGTLATMAPIGFVSSVSTRKAFRNAVVLSSAAAAVAGAATASFFHVTSETTALEAATDAVAWGFGASMVASLVGLAALQFFESAFDITTTLRLLDLTDRNHEGLQLLQEKAFGTFNHSLMVGTLADAAARAIGADPLLARAMAYYHDLGKTENPMFFIENQFGTTNPHDELDPEDSADIIRAHVTDGLALAAKFKIPSDVAEGIVSHHGDGIMRFFYEKAQQRSVEPVDPAGFRHIGHKPRSAETAIVMLADSLEAACRAVFQTEEPTPQAIEKVVDRVVDEKVNDKQLSESPVTLDELTRIRGAFLDSLVGHYHQRIQYPNFPGA